MARRIWISSSALAMDAYAAAKAVRYGLADDIIILARLRGRYSLFRLSSLSHQEFNDLRLCEVVHLVSHVDEPEIEAAFRSARCDLDIAVEAAAIVTEWNRGGVNDDTNER